MKKDLYNKIFAPSSCLTQPMLIGYLKGTLTEHETHKTEEHLIDCELCSEALDGLMLIKNENTISVLNADVKKVAQGKESRRRIAPIGIWLAAAATVAIIIASVVAVRVLTNIPENQLAMKSPATSDSLLKNSAPVSNAEEQESEESLITEKESGNVIELDEKPILTQSTRSIEAEDIKVISAQKETSNNNNVIEQEIAFSESESRENTIISDSDIKKEKVNSTSSVMAGAVRPEVQSAAKKSESPINDNQVVFIHDLKIWDYSPKIIQDKILEPDLKHTEAQYASPEEKLEKSANEIKPVISYKEKISPALLAYNNKNYISSITLFNSLLKENPADINALFYTGMSYYNLKNYSEAIKSLSLLSRNKDNIFYEESIFYLAVCQLNLNNKTIARILFKEVVELNSFYKSRALEQLNNLSD